MPVQILYMGQSSVVLLQDEPRGPSVLIEIPVPTAGQQRVNFPDVAQLRSTIDQKVIIKTVRLIPPEVLTNGVLTGAVNAPVTELQKMTVTIYSEGWEKGQTIPLITFNDFVFATQAMPYRNSATSLDNWVNVDWPKSYLQLANGTLTVGTPYVVMLDVTYVKMDRFNVEIQGPSK